ncbi:MAG: HD domain-containing protein [Candidatus Woesearchaeota archaeon]
MQITRKKMIKVRNRKIIYPVRDLYKAYKVPLHIQRHMRKVCRFAVALAKKIAKHRKVNIRQVRRACLLHDLFRLVDFSQDKYEEFARKHKKNRKVWDRYRRKYRGIDHGEAAYLFLLKKEPEIARIVRAHMYYNVLDVNKFPKTIEEKIVAYADKRVSHEKIVPLKKRLQEGHKRYGTRSTTADNMYILLEKELMAAAKKHNIINKKNKGL